MKQMNQQETAYNELYELCESYRQELGEVRVALADANMRNAKLIEEDRKRYEEQKRLQEQVEKLVIACEEEAEALRAENERLHASCTELTQCCTKLETLYKIECKRNDTVKADTVRKMQEMVEKKILEINPNLCGLLPFIDKIAKEMLEGIE